MKQLHPGARWIFRIRTYIGLLVFSVMCFWFIIPLIFGMFKANNSSAFALTFTLLAFMFFAVIIFAEVYARMTYSRWFYEFKNDGLRIEKGIIWKRYSNIPYDRIQNVDIQRGIFARMLGFSTINIQTAGYSARAQAEGNIPAVEVQEAEKIRDDLMKKIAKRK